MHARHPMRRMTVIMDFIQNVPGAICETHPKAIPETQVSSVLPEDPGPQLSEPGKRLL